MTSLKGKGQVACRGLGHPLLPLRLWFSILFAHQNPLGSFGKKKKKKPLMSGHPTRSNCHPRPSECLEVVPEHVLKDLWGIPRHRAENPSPITYTCFKGHSKWQMWQWSTGTAEPSMFSDREGGEKPTKKYDLIIIQRKIYSYELKSQVQHVRIYTLCCTHHVFSGFTSFTPTPTPKRVNFQTNNYTKACVSQMSGMKS